MVLFLIGLTLLIIPFCIVGFWTKRKVLPLIIATVLSLVFMVLPTLIQTFQAMMIYGTSDPQLMAGGISQAIISSAFVMAIIVPLLILFQWFMRRRKLNKTKAKSSAQFE